MNRGIVKRLRIAAACVGAVAVGVAGGLLLAMTGSKPVEGRVVDKAYEDQASVAVLIVLTAEGERERVIDDAHALVACYVSRSKPVHYPGCRR